MMPTMTLGRFEGNQTMTSNWPRDYSLRLAKKIKKKKREQKTGDFCLRYRNDDHYRTVKIVKKRALLK